jgi:DNA-damage-inducible protein D
MLQMFFLKDLSSDPHPPKGQRNRTILVFSTKENSMEPKSTKSVAIFERQGIRRIWAEDRWWFSVVDVVGVLTESSDYRVASRYWTTLKPRLNAEGFQVATLCCQFKMRAVDGKMRNTDCADVETLLRIIQSIPSPKAEPFKRWLAGVGAERLAELEDPAKSIGEWRRRAVVSYVASGYPQVWAEKRVEVILTRNALTHEWVVRGITPEEIPVLTDRLHMGAFGIDIESHKALKGYPIDEDGKRVGNLQNGMVLAELAITGIASAVTTDEHLFHDSHGTQEIIRDIDMGARAAKAAREAIEAVTGRPVVSPINAIPASNTLWAQLPEPGDDGDDC